MTCHVLAADIAQPLSRFPRKPLLSVPRNTVIMTAAAPAAEYTGHTI